MEEGQPSTGQPNAGDTVPASTDEGDARRVAHELLGQTHGLMFIAMQEDNLVIFCPQALMDAVRNSAPDLWLAFGRAQAAVASGQYDGTLVERGLSQKLAEPKHRGLALALEKLHEAVAAGAARVPGTIRQALQNAIAWARGPISSMSFIPGVEIIGEALDVAQAALGQMETATTT